VEVAYLIFLVFFIIEIVLATFSKTEVTSKKPFRTNGFFLSFFWVFDLIAIIAMLVDLKWVAHGIGINSVNDVTNNSNIAKAGRVVRLIRLVRLTRVFEMGYKRRKHRLQEQSLAELDR
jgi:hypothetical protein